MFLKETYEPTLANQEGDSETRSPALQTKEGYHNHCGVQPEVLHQRKANPPRHLRNSLARNWHPRVKAVSVLRCPDLAIFRGCVRCSFPPSSLSQSGFTQDWKVTGREQHTPRFLPGCFAKGEARLPCQMTTPHKPPCHVLQAHPHSLVGIGGSVMPASGGTASSSTAFIERTV